MAKRGFAAMDREKVRAIATKGGKAAHAAGTAHRFTSEEATAAGKKGGTAPHRSRGRQVVLPFDPKPPSMPFVPASTPSGIDVYVDDDGPATQRAPTVAGE